MVFGEARAVIERGSVGGVHGLIGDAARAAVRVILDRVAHLRAACVEQGDCHVAGDGQLRGDLVRIAGRDDAAVHEAPERRRAVTVQRLRRDVQHVAVADGIAGDQRVAAAQDRDRADAVIAERQPVGLGLPEGIERQGGVSVVGVVCLVILVDAVDAPACEVIALADGDHAAEEVRLVLRLCPGGGQIAHAAVIDAGGIGDRVSLQPIPHGVKREVARHCKRRTRGVGGVRLRRRRVRAPAEEAAAVIDRLAVGNRAVFTLQRAAVRRGGGAAVGVIVQGVGRERLPHGVERDGCALLGREVFDRRPVLIDDAAVSAQRPAGEAIAGEGNVADRREPAARVIGERRACDESLGAAEVVADAVADGRPAGIERRVRVLVPAGHRRAGVVIIARSLGHGVVVAAEDVARAGGEGDGGHLRVIGRLDIALGGRAVHGIERHGVFLRRPDGVEGDLAVCLRRQVADRLAAEIVREPVGAERPAGEAVAGFMISALRDRVRLIIGQSARAHAALAAVGVIYDRVAVGGPLGGERDVAAAHPEGVARLINRRGVVPAGEGVALAGRRVADGHVFAGGIFAAVKRRVHAAVRVVGDDVVLHAPGEGNVDLDVLRDRDVVLPIVLRTEQHAVGIHADGAVAGRGEGFVRTVLVVSGETAVISDARPGVYVDLEDLLFPLGGEGEHIVGAAERVFRAGAVGVSVLGAFPALEIIALADRHGVRERVRSRRGGIVHGQGCGEVAAVRVIGHAGVMLPHGVEIQAYMEIGNFTTGLHRKETDA